MGYEMTLHDLENARALLSRPGPAAPAGRPG